jgi:hypothetical protein
VAANPAGSSSADRALPSCGGAIIIVGGRPII